MDDEFEPRFGSITRTATIDENGSTVATTTKYKNGEQMPQIFTTYEVRTKVYTKQEETALYLKFSDEHGDDLDACFVIDHTPRGDKDGHYYVVTRWTTKSE